MGRMAMGENQKDTNQIRQTNRVYIYEIGKWIAVARILNYCGKNMAKKYDLHHWDNSLFKSMIIVGLCLLKNKVYLVTERGKAVATFQIKDSEDALFFEKLAVSPSVAGKGYGSYCMKLIETKAKQLGYKKTRMEVYDQSKHAIDFYLHKGYSQVGVINTLKYKDLIMEKVIG